ncbi:MAG: mycothiol synthase [Leucobacter sp.]
MRIFVSASTEPNGHAPAREVLDAAREIIAEAELVDGSSPVSDQAMIAAAQGQRQLMLFAEQRVTEGAPASGAEATHTTQSVAAGIVGGGELDLVVRPDARRCGIGTQALAQLTGEVHGEVRAWSHGENPAADALLESAGFAPVRTLYRMQLPADRLSAAIAGITGAPTESADGIAWPNGIHTTTFDPASPAQAAEWVRVNAAAFVDHPEQGKVTVEDLALITEESWFDPDDLILAFDATGSAQDPAGHLLGYAWVKTVRTPLGQPSASAQRGSTSSERQDAVECELYVLGVHPDTVGTGLGRLLLAAALRRMAAHDPSAVTLYVDGENTRAVELYEKNGFEVAHRSRQWLRDVTE